MTDINIPSKSAVRRAGSTIRRFKEGKCSDDELDAAIYTVVAFRSQFTEPLVAVHTQLRDIHKKLELQGEASQAVTQRLKKSATIVDKLYRESGLDMSRMQDIGGCRIVVESLEHLRLVEQEIRTSWGSDLHHVKDYIEEPRISGYRSVHMIVRESGFLIEIQLRTTPMHEWAVLVEAFSSVLGENLKQDGDHLIQNFLRVLSEIDALEECGITPGPDQLDKMRTLRTEVNAYLVASREARKDEL